MLLFKNGRLDTAEHPADNMFADARREWRCRYVLVT